MGARHSNGGRAERERCARRRERRTCVAAAACTREERGHARGGRSGTGPPAHDADGGAAVARTLSVVAGQASGDRPPRATGRGRWRQRRGRWPRHGVADHSPADGEPGVGCPQHRATRRPAAGRAGELAVATRLRPGQPAVAVPQRPSCDLDHSIGLTKSKPLNTMVPQLSLIVYFGLLNASLLYFKFMTGHNRFVFAYSALVQASSGHGQRRTGGQTVRKGGCLDAGLGWANPSQAPLFIKPSGAALPGAPRCPTPLAIPDSAPPDGPRARPRARPCARPRARPRAPLGHTCRRALSRRRHVPTLTQTIA